MEIPGAPLLSLTGPRSETEYLDLKQIEIEAHAAYGELGHILRDKAHFDRITDSRTVSFEHQRLIIDEKYTYDPNASHLMLPYVFNPYLKLVEQNVYKADGVNKPVIEEEGDKRFVLREALPSLQPIFQGILGLRWIAIADKTYPLRHELRKAFISSEKGLIDLLNRLQSDVMGEEEYKELFAYSNSWFDYLS